MPKDNIQRAIDRGTGAGADGAAIERVLYEGYGPGGAAILVEALTDNRNRASAESATPSTSHGGSLGEPGSVAWIFEKKGVIVVDGERYGEDDLIAAIDAGAEDVREDGELLKMICEPADLSAVREALEERGSRDRSPPSWRWSRRARSRSRAQRGASGCCAARRARRARRRRRGPRELRHPRGGAGTSSRPERPATDGSVARRHPTALPRITTHAGSDGRSTPAPPTSASASCGSRATTWSPSTAAWSRPPPTCRSSSRLERIHRALAELIAWHEPEAMAIEAVYFGKNVRSAIGGRPGAAGWRCWPPPSAASPASPTRRRRSRWPSAAPARPASARSSGWSARCSACPSRPTPTTPPTRSRWRSATAAAPAPAGGAATTRRRARGRRGRDDRRGPRRGDGAPCPTTS